MSGSHKTAWLLAACCALTAAGAGAWGWQEHRHAKDFDFTAHRLALLESDNVLLKTTVERQKKDAVREKESAARKSIEESVVKIRGLNFKQPVVYDALTREGIKKTIGQKLADQYSDQEFKNVATGLSALGLLPQNYPLKEKYIDLLGEQIAAFYDQHQHKLFMFEDASLASTQNRIVLAHELTHALQDQNFGLLKLPLEIRDDDDIAEAASALAEGDATIVMSDYMLQNFSLSSLSEDISSMFSQSTIQLQKSPRYLKEMLVFPYIHGQEFCATLRARGGYEAISEAYKNPPSSTSQILHPEKYLTVPREDPIRVQCPDTTVLGQKPIADNVVGEMGARILLSEWVNNTTGISASQGWRGDRYLVYDGGKALAWKTLWSDPDSTKHFYDALLKYVSKRFPGAVVDTSNPAIALFSSPPVTGSVTTDGRNTVVFTFGMTKEWAQAINGLFTK